jgi:hypothetical protein
MSRYTFILAMSLVAMVAVAACSAGPVVQPTSSSAPVGQSTQPTIAPPPSATPSATPSPTEVAVASPQPATPRPSASGFTAAEQHLLDGVQRGTKDCQPVRGSDVLPKNAVVGIECDSTDPAVAQVGFYQFANDEDMLSAYLERMRTEGVEIESGTCDNGESEHAYMPGPGMVVERAGCFLNEEGFANYRATLPGSHVYIGILGTSGNMVALEDFAWKGNEDVPGAPTLWFGGID